MGWAATAARQEQLRERILQGADPETLLLCEHDPVVTLGRRARPDHLLVERAELARRGVTVAAASRGGEATYHGPGQLVAYPVFRVDKGVVAHVEAMAAAVIDVLSELGIHAHWRRDKPGVWVAQRDATTEAKICAFGIHVRHRVAVHGLALNVTTDLRAFDAIVPCGMPGAAVTSIARLNGAAPSVAALAPRLASAIGRHFGLPIVEVDPKELPPLPDCQIENGTDNMIPA